MKISLKVKRDLSKQVLAAINRSIDQSAEELGEVILRETKANTPVITGRLRDSFESVDANDVSKTEVEIGSEVDYAKYVELGTEHQRAQFILTNASKGKEKDFLAILKRFEKRIKGL